jgi:hypothetical protein
MVLSVLQSMESKRSIKLKNQEWVGGKQIYSSNPSQNETDDWLSEFSEENLGYGVKAKPGSRTIESSTTNNKEQNK